MKKLMMLGGLLGFATGAGLALGTRSAEWPTAILRASVVCFAGGLMMRWWGKVWVANIRAAAVAAAARASANAPEAPAAPVRLTTTRK
jgi:hypothetical protein